MNTDKQTTEKSGDGRTDQQVAKTAPTLLELAARAGSGDKDAMQALYKRAARADDAAPDKLSQAITTASDGMTNVRITARPATLRGPKERQADQRSK